MPDKNGLKGDGSLTTPSNSSEIKISPVNSDPLSFSHVGKLLESIEGHLITSSVIFIFIGYVIMAATGNLKDCSQFKQYLLFLSILIGILFTRWLLLFIISSVRRK